MLIELREVIQERRQLSLHELSIHFDTAPEALEPMLEVLVRKGQVHVTNLSECTKSCNGCFCADRERMIVYEACESPDSGPRSEHNPSPS